MSQSLTTSYNIDNQSLDFEVLDLGLISYSKSLSIQQALSQEVYSGERKSVLILCEHSPTITLGRSYSEKNILRTREEIRSLGVEIYKTDRGGDVTLHLPGQLVAYPIFDLRILGRDINKFLRNLEAVVISLLEGYGLVGIRKAGATGVWVGDRKIASIGIKVKHWVASHGLSLNVNCPLSLFSLIRPCGQSIMMTSIAREGALLLPNMQEIKEEIVNKFYNIVR